MCVSAGMPQGVSAITHKLDISALLCLAGATLCWGSVPVMLNYLADPHIVPDGYTANAVRYPISALAYLPWLVVAIRRGGLGRFWLTALIPSAINVAGQTLWGLSPYYLPAGQLAFLFRLSALFVFLGPFGCSEMSDGWLAALCSGSGPSWRRSASRPCPR